MRLMNMGLIQTELTRITNQMTQLKQMNPNVRMRDLEKLQKDLQEELEELRREFVASK